MICTRRKPWCLRSRGGGSARWSKAVSAWPTTASGSNSNPTEKRPVTPGLPPTRLAVSRLGALTARWRHTRLTMGMVLGTALAAIAFTVLHYRVGAQYTFAVLASTGFIWHGQTPFHGRPSAANAAP